MIMTSQQSIPIVQALDTTFDDIIDVRSPAEFADDHMPGAINLPVLDNEQRARIGTLFTQVSPFAAQKQGAALIAHNIARHLEQTLHDRPKGWRPLIYCWRGGMRSGAMAHVLAQVGWKTVRLEGGYKAYRRHVIDALATLPQQFDFRVICGPTGSGKSRLLQALAVNGAQVLDLEALACHRGSLLGNLPDQLQPSQKMFETRIWQRLRTFSPDSPVFIEAESRKIGVLSVPGILLECMRSSLCTSIKVPLQARIELLLADYAHFLQNPELLNEHLTRLVALHGHKVISTWCDMAERGEWRPLVTELLEQHYDPAYRRSSNISFQQLQHATVLPLPALDSASLQQAAAILISNEKTS